MTAGVEAWLIAALAGHLPIGTLIERDQPIFSFGIDSVRLAVITADLAEFFGVALDSTLFYEASTVADAAAHVATLCGGAKAPACAAPDAATLASVKEEIAIVGIACRMPGAPSKDAFWRLLTEGRSGIARKSARRTTCEELVPPDGDLPRLGGYLDAIDEFDAHFFRISPAEAQAMDPQQRLLLQTAWEALEDAGVPPSSLKRVSVGVFVGISHSDYGLRHFAHPGSVTGLSGTGNALSVAANRISFVLDLRGPSIAVDTACSSSLTALHLACASLREEECESALVGGVNIIIGSALTTALFSAGMLSPSGRCLPFEAGANGYVRGEGCGIVVLKRLSQALRNNDRIYAIIKASVVNQDGRAAALTAPSLPAQEALLRTACFKAGVKPSSLDYVEAHGTGTPLGDPVEAAALGHVLGAGRPPERPLLIGSVKANIGHLEAAAGIAGLIKASLALHCRVLPAQHAFRDCNPLINFGSLGLQVAHVTQAWPQGGSGLCGVSSFGFGGTNAHVILRAPPHQPQSQPDHRAILVTLSAPCGEALRQQAKRWSTWLAEGSGAGPEIGLAEIGDTSLFGRERMARTRSFVVASKTELSCALTDFGNEAPAEPQSGVAGPGRLVFQYTAHGLSETDWQAALADPDPLFRSAMMQAREHAPILAASRPHGKRAADWQQLAELQVGLAMLLYSYGIVPAASVGNGPGRAIADLLHGPVAADISAGDIVIVLGHLAAPLRQGQPNRGAAAVYAPAGVFAAWAPGVPPSRSVLAAVALLLDAGHRVRRRFIPGATRRPVSLPPYDWQRDRFWFQDKVIGLQEEPAKQELFGLREVMTMTQPSHGRAPVMPALARPDLSAIAPLADADPLILASGAARGAAREAARQGRARPARLG